MAPCNEIIVHVIHTFEGRVFFITCLSSCRKTTNATVGGRKFEIMNCGIDFTCWQCTEQSKFAATVLCRM